MPGLLPLIDPDGLLEFSVVYTDRSLNHMSKRFQGVMRDISRMLKEVYQAHRVALVPGSGTFGMESVARQFATGKHVMVVRNGWFSYRWTQIFEMGHIPASHSVMKARRIADASQAPWAPAPIAEVVAAIAAEKPAVVFAPHVETSAGMMLPDDYLRALADAVLRDVVRQLDPATDTAARALATSRAKSRCGDAALAITRAAIQFHGAIGFTEDCDVGLYVKRALTLATWLGNGRAHRARYARLSAQASQREAA